MDSKKLYSALYALTAKKGTRYPSLAGVFFDGDSIVASDANAIVVAKTEYPPEWEGKILNKAGKEINEKPLNYKGVLPIDPERMIREESDLYDPILNLSGLKQALKMVPKSPDVDGERVVLEIAGSAFYPPLLLKALAIFEALEQTPRVFIYTAGVGVHNKAYLLSKEGSLGVVCPVLKCPVGNHSQKFSIEEALCADLL